VTTTDSNITQDMTPIEVANLLERLEEGHQAAWLSTREVPWQGAEYQARFQNAAEVDAVFRDVMWETVENGMRRPGEPVEDFAERAESEARLADAHKAGAESPAYLIAHQADAGVTPETIVGSQDEIAARLLNDPSTSEGHAYAKALRTVKTCVGSEWCRFGTQDSTRMGKELERALWRMYAPHKVKLAVSGCPRNCAESGIKDVGVIGVDSGWEIYVAGNGGIKTEVAQFLVRVATHAEVLEYAGAFLQLYREEGWYLERTVHYVARVGIDSVRKRVVEDASGRRALWERLQFALDKEPDPWSEPLRAGVDLRQFEKLAV